MPAYDFLKNRLSEDEAAVNLSEQTIYYPTEFVEVWNQIWTVTVNQAAEGKTVLPAIFEKINLYTLQLDIEKMSVIYLNV